ncbi:MAG TPA: S16 family serine protease [Bacillaceae bacterium]
MKKFNGLTLIFSFLVLCAGNLLLYINDVTSGFVYVGILLFAFTFLSLLFILLRSKGRKTKTISILTIAMALLLLFEIKLLKLDSFTFVASIPAKPIELLSGSGIHLMVVNTLDIQYVKDPELVSMTFDKEQKQIIHLYKVNNQDRYQGKNMELLRLAGFQNNEFQKTIKDVNRYLGKELHAIRSFSARTDLHGNSAGLGLALTGLMGEDKLYNSQPFGVTGAITSTGAVKPIGMVKEKVIIADKYGLPRLIVPAENEQEALDTKETLNLEIQIFSVHHIDDAVQIIEEFNSDKEI